MSQCTPCTLQSPHHHPSLCHDKHSENLWCLHVCRIESKIQEIDADYAAFSEAKHNTRARGIMKRLVHGRPADTLTVTVGAGKKTPKADTNRIRRMHDTFQCMEGHMIFERLSAPVLRSHLATIASWHNGVLQPGVANMEHVNLARACYDYVHFPTLDVDVFSIPEKMKQVQKRQHLLVISTCMDS